MQKLNELLEITITEGASDLHLTVGIPPVIRVNNRLVKLKDKKLTPADTEEFAKEILGDFYGQYDSIGEFDTSYSVQGLGRFRVNVFKQRNSTALAIRVIALKIPTLDDLNYPKIFKDICAKKRGLVLVTGPTGSGKSTTLASMINEINHTREAHVVTLEDPIEFLHKHNKSIVNQREVGKDTISYQRALKSLLREDPDVILIGEMRDLETISIALTAAETGHLVFSTVHTVGAAKTIDRIVDVFPPHQQQQIRTQLSSVLEGIISQQLVPTKDDKRCAALEIMIPTPAIRNLIREGKTYQIESSMQTGSKYGMKTMDMALVELYKKEEISEETAINSAVDREIISRMINY
ncbi:type IV pilus twitching motility protein PilT [Clostridium tarantellae]|uniref:PilT/PilU family type 4a pilus ATPase n=1 Tax=Clostridium tarantellae TaxID=39493 RepID=A0A6I1MLH8_9CLOT|nr:type IV pilus twitching motility protein PilT [Clostridium tarantellae]MPQ43092.1 PilT/PilU family type 4a pilus ATPase [Clostridium tarantellae]